MKFSVLAEAFQSIEQSSGRLDKTKILAEILQQATPQETRIISYISQGVLLPPYKSQQFQISRKALLLF